jgi:archaellum component FlaG (FlaF/FlaG flagellin family)
LHYYATDVAGNNESVKTVAYGKLSPSLKLSGEPALTIRAGEAYSFTPTVDAGISESGMIFSIINMPSWATFDPVTGAVGGAPTEDDVGEYKDITLVLNNGSQIVVLGPFSITVFSGENQPPTAPALVSPENGAVDLDPATVELVWKSSTDVDKDPISYEVQVCENEDFSDCEAKSVTNSQKMALALVGIGGSGGMILFGLTSLGIRRKSWIKIGLVLLSISLLSACGTGGSGDKDEQEEVVDVFFTVDNLNSATTYYWKIVAKDDQGNQTESEVRNFTTQ